MARERGREGGDAAVAEPAVPEGAGLVVRGDPDVEPERAPEVAEPPLDLGVRPVSLAAGLEDLALPGRVLPDAGEVRAPRRLRGGVAVARRQRVAPAAEIEQEPGHGAEVVREERLMLGVQPDRALPHGEVLVPPAELHLRAGERVVALHDRGVERDGERRMEEVEEVRGRRPEALDPALVEPPDRGEELLLAAAARARVKEPRERELVLPVLVDVGDAELRLPEEGVVRALEDLALLRDRADDRLERRALVDVAEGARLDLRDDGPDSPPDGAEVLEAFLPEEPRAVRPTRIRPPALDELACSLGPHRSTDSTGFRRRPRRQPPSGRRSRASSGRDCCVMGTDMCTSADCAAAGTAADSPRHERHAPSLSRRRKRT